MSNARLNARETDTKDIMETGTCQTGMSTRLIHNQLLTDFEPQVLSSLRIDDALVAQNRNNKLFGSYGETLVVFHDSQSPLGKFITAFQSAMIERFGVASQDTPHGMFVSKDSHKANPTTFSLIPNPHTTIIAMRVIDAHDESGWQQSLIQSFLFAKFAQYQPEPDEGDSILQARAIILSQQDLSGILTKLPEILLKKVLGVSEHAVNLREYILLQSHLPLIYPELEKAILRLTRTSQPIQLTLESICLNSNGSVGIKWQKHPDLVELRETLTKVGAIAKHGNEIITTTLGYFPYCTDSHRLEIIRTLEAVMRDINVKQHMPQLRYDVDLATVQLVRFTRNDLHVNHIDSQPFLTGEHVSDEINLVDFPVITHQSDETATLGTQQARADVINDTSQTDARGLKPRM